MIGSSKMKKYLIGVVFFGLLNLFAGLTWAHSDEYLEATGAAHGGQIRMAGPYHFELVAKDGELRLYVTDHMDREILTKGGSGKANIFDKDGKKVSIALVPIFANFMKGTGEFTITPETTISVFVVLDGAETQAARFTPLAKKVSTEASEEKGHEHHHEVVEHEKQPTDQGDNAEHEHHHEDTGHEQQPAADQGDAAEDAENEENEESEEDGEHHH